MSGGSSMLFRFSLSVFLFSLTLFGSSYTKDVEPILQKRCAVCHSCYNAPCQLKMESFDGVLRGATKKNVYDAARLDAVEPTRLFMDAFGEDAWRKKGFYGVLDGNVSIMQRMVELKAGSPAPKGEFHAESEDTSCVKDSDEMDKFAKKHPNWGMPFGMPALSKNEYEIVMAWLKDGAVAPTATQKKKESAVSMVAQKNIAKWEQFLNSKDLKQQIVARYLYEHFFLAHIYFSGDKQGDFYELVRSKTAPLKPIEIIATARPYDDPMSKKVYYRFRKISGVPTHKTHMVVKFDDDVLKNIKDILVKPKWTQKPYQISYDIKTAANPLVAYEQIPAKARYKFLLSNVQFIVDTFIRGPVCKGQLALNSIDDHFWVAFMDPEYDLGVKYPEFYREQKDSLALPNELGNDLSLWSLFSDDYRDRYKNYYKAKMALYDANHPKGLPLDAIWKGERAEDAPLLTVYRHFDSASVHRGVVGELPKTAWVMDYAQLERTYYALVAGFDVFGNLSHQTNIRRFMDFIRVAGELNFVHFLPKSKRLDTIKSWYIGEDELASLDFESAIGLADTQVLFKTENIQQEFIEKIVKEHILPSTKITFDDINYFGIYEPMVYMPSQLNSRADYHQAFRSLTAPGTGFIKEVHEYGVDLLYLHLKNTPQGDKFISMVINRWHDNVNTLFKEKKRLNPAKDTIDFFEGSIGSYPNYFFEVEFGDLADFFDMMHNYDGSPVYKAKLHKYGINRSNENFWQTHDWFMNDFKQKEPLNWGLYDLNRYYYKAI